MGVLTPLRDLLRVSAEAGEAIRRLPVRGKECDLDSGEVGAFAETFQYACILQLAIALEVITGLGLYGGRAPLEQPPHPGRRPFLKSPGPRPPPRLRDANAAPTRA